MVWGAVQLGAPACASMGANPSGERLERMKRSPQWAGDHFVNRLPTPPGLQDGKGTWDMAREQFGDQGARIPSEPPPVVVRTAESLAGEPSTAPRVTWMGHASSLLELGGKRFLIDPVWSERASPFSFVGPKRFHPVPIALEDLPALDAVVISHDHYDHLDMPTIKTLLKRESLRFITPLGVGAHLEKWGVSPARIVELDWWEHVDVGGVRLVAAPARHFTGRGPRSRNPTLWASFAFISGDHRVFFSGDGGMHADFEEIGERLGPFELTLMEIGAYNSWWRNVHLGPEQAVDAHLRLGGGLFVPVHWGTFNLALHGWTEPVERLLVETERRGVQTAVPRPGETVDALAPGPVERWWPTLPWKTAEESPIVADGLPWNTTAETSDASP